ncbi:hypothetical protein ACO1PK_02885 [Alishewanella sp. d11]|uniref:hypothetical protein n=1 Tax=Alishewanella sp. d11 TaxID=3414030 RepID=UPI003BF78339
MPLAAKANFFTHLAAVNNVVENESASASSEAAAHGTDIKSIDVQSIDVQCTDAGSAVDVATEISAHSRYQPIPATRLADDINTILPQTRLTHWQIDSLASHSQINEQILITPPLALLQQTALKRQLWQLLSEQFYD